MGGLCLSPMPEFMHATPDEKNLLINTDTGKAMYDGKRFHEPYTLDAIDSDFNVVPIPLAVFRTIDFSRLERVALLASGTGLALVPVGYQAVFMTESI